MYDRQVVLLLVGRRSQTVFDKTDGRTHMTRCTLPARRPKSPATLVSYLWGGVTGLTDIRWLFGMQPAFTERPAPKEASVTILIPAHNEEAHIRAAVESLFEQTHTPFSIIVVDDGSKDATGSIADALAIEHPGLVYVVHTKGTGSKAGAINAALDSHLPIGELSIVMDADTQFAPNAIEKAVPHFYDPAVAVVCGHVLPKPPKDGKPSLWWRSKLVEYILGQGLTKEAQNSMGAVVVMSGCFSMYATSLIGRFSDATMAEDMMKTWELALNGWKAAYEPLSQCYAAEPETFAVFWNQRRRWMSGFFQCYLLLMRDLFRRNLRLACIVHYMFVIAMMDLFLLPITIYMVSKNLTLAILLPNILDIAAMAVALGGYAYHLGGMSLMIKSLKSVPAALVGTIVIRYVFWHSLVQEWFLKKPLKKWVAGH